MVGVSKSYRPGQFVLKDIYLSFYYGAKIGVLGLNGAGKSSLLRIIAGLDDKYDGTIQSEKGITFGYLAQEPQLDPEKTVREIVEEGAGEAVQLLKDYEAVGLKYADQSLDVQNLVV
ncbi:MAG TPA: ATP-binding cassette domain-containing protein, partial [Bacteroidetes bacterium]|nr:ATP-binding cassette domain-containing protein [Bacteroidota bacterium]